MLVTRLGVRDFRSYAAAELRPGPGLIQAADGGGFLYLLMPIRLNV